MQIDRGIMLTDVKVSEDGVAHLLNGTRGMVGIMVPNRCLYHFVSNSLFLLTTSNGLTWKDGSFPAR